MSPSDLKHIDIPEWIDPAKGEPTLTLFSVVDDRSGVAYQEYHCVYVEDAESALRFLYAAMAPKTDPGFPIQGRPKMLYLDNGPVAKSRVFQDVMLSLGVDWLTHIPAGKDGERVTVRSKGKVGFLFVPSRKPTKRCTIFINLKRSSRPMTGCCVTCFTTMNNRTVCSRIHAGRTGYSIFPRKGSVKCATGNSTAALPGSLSGAKWVLMPE